MKARDEVGWARLLRYGGWRAFEVALHAVPTPFLRAAVLRAAGASIGRDTLIMPGMRLENLDRHGGPAALTIGRDCWIGYDVHVDLAADVAIGDQVSVGSSAMFVTHLNVGYADHPLQPRFPSRTEAIEVGAGSFVGAGAILLAGTRLGPETFLAAGAVVGGHHPGREMLGGSPARRVRSWEPSEGPAEVAGGPSPAW